MKICIKIQLETCHSIFNKDVFVVANCHRSTEQDSTSKLRGVCYFGLGGGVNVVQHIMDLQSGKQRQMVKGPVCFCVCQPGHAHTRTLTQTRARIVHSTMSVEKNSLRHIMYAAACSPKPRVSLHLVFNCYKLSHLTPSSLPSTTGREQYTEGVARFQTFKDCAIRNRINTGRKNIDNLMHPLRKCKDNIIKETLLYCAQYKQVLMLPTSSWMKFHTLVYKVIS